MRIGASRKFPIGNSFADDSLDDFSAAAVAHIFGVLADALELPTRNFGTLEFKADCF
jgi:hypothetical protein